MNRPPKPSHLNSPVVHHRPESGDEPLRLWATLAAAVIFVLLMIGLVVVLRWLGGGEETVESLGTTWFVA